MYIAGAFEHENGKIYMYRILSSGQMLIHLCEYIFIIGVHMYIHSIKHTFHTCSAI